MITNGNDKALESYKIFPYIAWIVIFSFAYFVYGLTAELQDKITRLETQTRQHQGDLVEPKAQPLNFNI